MSWVMKSGSSVIVGEELRVVGRHLDELAGRRSRTPGAGLVRLLLASRVVHVVRTDEAMEEAALNVYERLDDARLSFTDCASFAVMRAREIHIAYSTQGGQAESA